MTTRNACIGIGMCMMMVFSNFCSSPTSHQRLTPHPPRSGSPLHRRQRSASRSRNTLPPLGMFSPRANVSPEQYPEEKDGVENFLRIRRTTSVSQLSQPSSAPIVDLPAQLTLHPRAARENYSAPLPSVRPSSHRRGDRLSTVRASVNSQESGSIDESKDAYHASPPANSNSIHIVINASPSPNIPTTGQVALAEPAAGNAQAEQADDLVQAATACATLKRVTRKYGFRVGGLTLFAAGIIITSRYVNDNT